MSSISYFRIYKIDNSLCDFNLKNNEILNYINAGISKELKEEDISKLVFKKVDFDIEYFSFSGITTENKKDDNIDLPEWFNFLLLFGDKNEYKYLEDRYIKVKTSILSVFRIVGNLYIIAYGNGFHSIPRELIDRDFGVELGKKMITTNGKIKSIYQSVIKGDLENTFKSLKKDNKYNPMLDPSNLGKLTKGLNGFANSKQLFHDIPSLQLLNISLEGNEGLKFNLGKIDKNILLQIIKKINETFEAKVTNALKIPDLKKINKNDEKYLTILNKIATSKKYYFSLYLLNKYIFGDNPILGRIISFDILEDGQRFSFSEKDFGILENFDLISILNEKNFSLSDLSQVRFTKINIEYETQGEKSKQLGFIPSLLDCISGEIEVNNEFYLFEGQNIYFPNQDFKDIVISDFKLKIDKLTIKDKKGKRFLLDWDLVKEKKEADFNKKHDKSLDSINGIDYYYCLDKGVSKTYGYGKGNEIEICDILKKEANKYYFIHVKKTGGAYIRELFSQGRVSTSLIIDEVDGMRKHIKKHTKITINKNVFLNRDFIVVYAIKKSTKNTFTLYAKYDFISTLEYFHERGMDTNVFIYYIN